MTQQIVHYIPTTAAAKKYRPQGFDLVIDMEVYERNARFNGMPLTFLGFVNFMGTWTEIRKVD